MGSVRDLATHSKENVLAAVGLGRFVYVYNTANKKMIAKVYLKQKLNCVLFSSEGRTKSTGSKDDASRSSPRRKKTKRNLQVSEDSEENGSDACSTSNEEMSDNGCSHVNGFSRVNRECCSHGSGVEESSVQASQKRKKRNAEEKEEEEEDREECAAVSRMVKDSKKIRRK